MRRLLARFAQLRRHGVSRNASWIFLGQGANFLLQAGYFVLLARWASVNDGTALASFLNDHYPELQSAGFRATLPLIADLFPGEQSVTSLASLLAQLGTDEPRRRPGRRPRSALWRRTADPGSNQDV